LLIFDMGGEKVSWTSPILVALACTATASACVFTLVEHRYAKEPIFPLRLLKHSGVVLPYLLLMLANASQTAVSCNRSLLTRILLIKT
jgi:predicted MFS family arabinose efflux permease